MEDNTSEELINNILSNPQLYKKLSKEELIEVLKYCLADIKNLKIETERLHNLYDKDKIEEIDNFYNENFLEPVVSDDSKENYKSKIEYFQNKYLDVLNTSTKLQTLYDNSVEIYNELMKDITVPDLDGTPIIMKLHEFISNFEENSKHINNYEIQLTTIIKNCQDQRNSINKDQADYRTKYDYLEKNFNDINDKIENLLPGATTAGLSSAFRNAKLLYKKTESINNFNNTDLSKKSKIVHHIKASLPYLNNAIKFTALYTVFLAPLIIIIFQGYDTLKTLNLNNTNDWIKVLLKAPLSIPLIYISLFGHRAIRERHEMYEEYHHKQRIMEIYEGISREISNLINETTDDEDKKEVIRLKKDLLDTLLQTVKNNPSEIVFNRYKTNKLTKESASNFKEFKNKAIDVIKEKM